jgi:hypothetical protein
MMQGPPSRMALLATASSADVEAQAWLHDAAGVRSRFWRRACCRLLCGSLLHATKDRAARELPPVQVPTNRVRESHKSREANA